MEDIYGEDKRKRGVKRREIKDKTGQDSREGKTGQPTGQDRKPGLYHTEQVRIIELEHILKAQNIEE